MSLQSVGNGPIDDEEEFLGAADGAVGINVDRQAPQQGRGEVQAKDGIPFGLGEGESSDAVESVLEQRFDVGLVQIRDPDVLAELWSEPRGDGGGDEERVRSVDEDALDDALDAGKSTEDVELGIRRPGLRCSSAQPAKRLAVVGETRGHGLKQVGSSAFGPESGRLVDDREERVLRCGPKRYVQSALLLQDLRRPAGDDCCLDARQRVGQGA